MPLIALIIIFVCIPLAILALILRRAPYGHEEASGFHFSQGDGCEIFRSAGHPQVKGYDRATTASENCQARMKIRECFRVQNRAGSLPLLLPRI